MTGGRESQGGPEQGAGPRQGEKDSKHAQGQPNIGMHGPHTVRKASTCRDGLEESIWAHQGEGAAAKTVEQMYADT